MAKHVVVPGGVLGTQTGSAYLSCVDKDVWEAATPGHFMGMNGEPLVDQSALMTNNGDGTWTLTAAFPAIVPGTYCNIYSTPSNTPGLYKIISTPDPDRIIISDTSLTGSVLTTAEAVSIAIGGAYLVNTGADLSNLFALSANDVDGDLNNIDILINKPDIPVSNTIALGTLGGSSTTKVNIYGTDSYFAVDGTTVRITPAVPITRMLIVTSSNSYVTFNYIDFNGAGNAGRCVYAFMVNTFNCVFYRCKFHDVTGDGVACRMAQAAIIDCDIYSNGYNGLNLYSTSNTPVEVTGNRIYGNGNAGIYLNQPYTNITNNLIYGNISDGIYCSSSSDGSTIAHNTVYNNGGGISVYSTSALYLKIYNNAVRQFAGQAYCYILADTAHYFTYCGFSSFTNSSVRKSLNRSFMAAISEGV